MKLARSLCAILFAAWPLVGRTATEGLSPESEIWNAGVAAYEAGDVTNAVLLLRPLLGTKSHGARVAEILALSEFEAAKACAEDDPEGRLAHLESSAVLAQMALRAAPADARLRKNFAEATRDIPRLKDEIHLKALREKLGKKSPQALVKAALASSRAGLAESSAPPSPSAETRLAAADALEARFKAIADTCRVLPTEELGDLIALAERTASAAGNLESGTDASARELEGHLTTLYRGLLDPWSALDEDLLSQSNACLRAAESGGRSWQEDALSYSEIFESRFPAWLENYEQQAQADTNAPPYTEEMKVQIETLTLELEDLQKALCDNPTPEGEASAMALIRELLSFRPKSSQDQSEQQNNEQNEQQQQQSDEQDSQQGEQQERSQDEQQAQNQEEQQQQGQEGEEEEKGDEKDASPAEEADASDQEKADKDLLDRILERSAENKGKNKAKDLKKRPPTGSNRDW